MADNLIKDWREWLTGSLIANVYARECGWHVSLQYPGRTIGQALRPQQLGKSCIPFRRGGDLENLRTEAEAFAIGLANIAAGVAEDCDNL